MTTYLLPLEYELRAALAVEAVMDLVKDPQNIKSCAVLESYIMFPRPEVVWPRVDMTLFSEYMGMMYDSLKLSEPEGAALRLKAEDVCGQDLRQQIAEVRQAAAAVQK